jgi:hypothetical protein
VVLRGAVAAVLESVMLAPTLFCDRDNPTPSQSPTKLSRPKLQPAVANAALLTRRDVNAHCGRGSWLREHRVPGVSRTAEYSAALHLERGEAAVQVRVTRSESGVSSVAAAPRSSAASLGEADGSAKG